MTTFVLKRVKIWRHMPHSNAKNSYPWGGGEREREEAAVIDKSVHFWIISSKNIICLTLAFWEVLRHCCLCYKKMYSQNLRYSELLIKVFILKWSLLRLSQFILRSWKPNFKHLSKYSSSKFLCTSLSLSPPQPPCKIFLWNIQTLQLTL